MHHNEWTIDQFEVHYVYTINKRPNGLGQYYSNIFGQSHGIEIAAQKRFPVDDVHAAIGRELSKEKEAANASR